MAAFSLIFILIASSMVPLAIFSNVANADERINEDQTTEQVDISTLPPPAEAIPVPVIEDERMSQLSSVALSYPGLKEWSMDEWKVGTVGYRGTIGDSISYDYAVFYLQLPSEADAPEQCPSGWEAVIEVNMQTLEPHALYVPSELEHTCAVPVSDIRSEPDPSNYLLESELPNQAPPMALPKEYRIASSTSMTNVIDEFFRGVVNFILPSAYAAGPTNGRAIAVQNEVIGFITQTSDKFYETKLVSRHLK